MVLRRFYFSVSNTLVGLEDSSNGVRPRSTVMWDELKILSIPRASQPHRALVLFAQDLRTHVAQPPVRALASELRL